MGLPFEPEPDVVLRARYPKAVEECIDVREVEAGKIQRPGQSRKHVFDLTDGMRLIISRETDGTKTYYHVSASMQEGTPRMPEFLRSIILAMRNLGMPRGRLDAVVTKGVLHLMMDENQWGVREIIGGVRGNPMWN